MFVSVQMDVNFVDLYQSDEIFMFVFAS
jgi:hypothetical protein